MNGYAGKILRINLTDKKVTTMDTADYEQWGGGHGMGSAIFWDLVEDKAISGFDPANVITIMTSPLTGTLVPAAGSRAEVQGIGVQSYPVEWFTRSNLGGRFAAMLKYAGWDGVVIEGRAASPVMIDIVNNDVRIKDAAHLWGRDAWETQEMIWRECSDGSKELQSSQRPAVLTIGPAGENLCRVACLVHDAGHTAGQGGFGAVWGSKNLKAVSVMGTGSIAVACPNDLMNSRLWSRRNFEADLDDPRTIKAINKDTIPEGFGSPSIPVVFWGRPDKARPQACIGCHSSCHSRTDSGRGNEASCVPTLFYNLFDMKRNSGFFVRSLSSLLRRLGQNGLAFFAVERNFGNQTNTAYEATDLLQKYGVNAYELWRGLAYIESLYKMGVLGKGKPVDCDLPFDKLGELAFAERFVEMIAMRRGIGDDMAEGFFRAARRWGRLDEDQRSGLLQYPYWGLPEHGYDPRAEIEWGYGSILGDRDITEHDFNILYWMPSIAKWNVIQKPPVTAEEVVNIFAEKLMPYDGDPLMLDFSTENMYSEHIVKLVAWHRHYSRFWKQSALFCDWLFPDFYNPNTPDNRGITGEGEPRFFNAVTGKGLSFNDGMELGRKIWNLDNAIWTLQGRHRDMVHFAPYIYEVPFAGGDFGGSLTKFYMPGREKGTWKYIPLNGRHIDKEKFEQWKTKFYLFEGWDPASGRPTRTTLESLGMQHVADELEAKGKLGKDT